jgi:hypothetical protein
MIFSAHRKPRDGEMQIVTVPPLQQLYGVPISSIAQQLIKKWTYLDPGVTLPEQKETNSAGFDLFEEGDSSEDVGGPDQSPPEPPRRRFTFQEYDQELESGDIYYHPQLSQRDYKYDQYEEHDWYHKDFSNGTSRVYQSKIRERPQRRSSIYLDLEGRYTRGIDRDKRNAGPTPNLTIYNTTRTGNERDVEFRPLRLRRNPSPGPASRSRGGPGKWTLKNELEDLRQNEKRPV